MKTWPSETQRPPHRVGDPCRASGGSKMVGDRGNYLLHHITHLSVKMLVSKLRGELWATVSQQLKDKPYDAEKGCLRENGLDELHITARHSRAIRVKVWSCMSGSKFSERNSVLT